MSDEDTKTMLKSKTFWANVIALCLLAYNLYTGRELIISPESTAIVMALINIGLRKVTKQEVVWSN